MAEVFKGNIYGYPKKAKAYIPHNPEIIKANISQNSKKVMAKINRDVVFFT